jgi:hypothetical protein
MRSSVTDTSSRDYFQRRAEQELAASEEATDARAAKSHRELAEHFLGLANGGTAAADEAAPLDSGTLPKDFLIVP